MIANTLVRRMVRMVLAAVVFRLLSGRNGRMMALLLLAIPTAARACSVCFGDPESPMMKGAVAGVYVMVGFIGFLLVCIAGTACFWTIRARRLSAGLPADGMD